jgi:hypothetical protein
MNDGTFREFDQDEKGAFGPRSVLLCGFSVEETAKICDLLKVAGAPGHRVILCTDAMIGKSVEEALETTDVSDPLPSERLPRVMVLSGLAGQQVRALIDSYAATGLRRPIFAVSTPSNLGFSLRDLLVELLKEHQAMTQRR